ncbi:MAG: type II toxin-antitoxin system PemK/MazF family toxin [Candidatus Zambryskibacteria bacterium]
MKKDFERWHKKKEKLEEIEQRPNFHEREIWFCYLGLNIGDEEDGKGDDCMRPIIIVRKFNNNIFWAIPTTRTKKEGVFYFKFHLEKKNGFAILSQIATLDGKRLGYKIGEISKKDFFELKEKLKKLLP